MKEGVGIDIFDQLLQKHTKIINPKKFYNYSIGQDFNILIRKLKSDHPVDVSFVIKLFELTNDLNHSKPTQEAREATKQLKTIINRLIFAVNNKPFRSYDALTRKDIINDIYHYIKRSIKNPNKRHEVEPLLRAIGRGYAKDLYKNLSLKDYEKVIQGTNLGAQEKVDHEIEKILSANYFGKPLNLTLPSGSIYNGDNIHGSILIPINIQDYAQIPDEISDLLVDICRQLYSQIKSFKIIVSGYCTFVSDKYPSPLVRPIYSGGKRKEMNFINFQEDIESTVITLVGELIYHIQATEDSGSGWVFEALHNITITYISQKKTKGKSYVPTPPIIAKHNHSVTNVENNDDLCFAWAICAGLYQEKERQDFQMKNPNKNFDKHKKKHYEKYLTTFDWTGVKFPVPLDSKVYDNFCFNNKMSIAVFTLSEEAYDIQKDNAKHYFAGDYLIPYYCTDEIVPNKHVDLLLIKGLDNEGHQISHYITITKLHTFFDPNKHTLHMCKRCLTSFRDKSKLEDHVKRKICKHFQSRVITPEAGKFINFSKYSYTYKQPYTIYWDTEAVLKKVPQHIRDESKLSYQEKIHEHETAAIFAYVCCIVPDDEYHGKYFLAIPETEEDKKDLLEHFIWWLVKMCEELIDHQNKVIAKNKVIANMKISKEEQNLFYGLNRCEKCKPEKRQCQECYDKAKNINCIICNKSLQKEARKARHHHHFTGNYLGPAHDLCIKQHKIDQLII